MAARRGRLQEEYRRDGRTGGRCQECYVTGECQWKGKVYKKVVRPAMMYGMEATQIMKVNEKRMNVAK